MATAVRSESGAVSDIEPVPPEAAARCERIMAGLRRVTRATRAEFQGPKPVASLTVEQLLVLGELRECPLPMSRIAQFRGVTLSAATSLVNRLVGKGLVERLPVPTDRRLVLIGVTPLGMRVATEVHERVKRMFFRKLSALTEDETKHVDDMMTILERSLL